MRSTKLALSAALALALGSAAAGAEDGSGTAAPQASGTAPAAAEASDEGSADADASASVREGSAEEAATEAESADTAASSEEAAAAASASGDAAAEDAAPAADSAETASAEAGAAPEEEADAPSATAAAEAVAPEGEAAEPGAPAPAASGAEASELGAVGYDEQGRRGRIHVVVPGDTLWDISDAYLGTPWVWPSVWTENEAIENPHLIHPGDRIWITAGEMRRVTVEEAERFLANEPPGDEAEPPAALDESDAMAPGADEPDESYRFSPIQTTGFISEESFRGSFSIVESRKQQELLGDHDRVVIGRGEGDVEEGERFSIFRPGEAVRDPETGERVGYATQELGWLEVSEVHPESATAVIRLSRGEIEVGDHLREREEPEPEIAIAKQPDAEGAIVHVLRSKLTVGEGDIVYLNRGTAHGLERGSPLEVFRPRGEAVDAVRDAKVALPDAVVGKLLVVRADEGTAAAVVTHSASELERGDRFRGAETIAWREREPR